MARLIVLLRGIRLDAGGSLTVRPGFRQAAVEEAARIEADRPNSLAVHAI